MSINVSELHINCRSTYFEDPKRRNAGSNGTENKEVDSKYVGCLLFIDGQTLPA